jgi:class 3 adenylate cyclase
MSASVAAPEVLLRRPLGGVALAVLRAVLVVYGLLAIVVYLQWLPRWLGEQAPGLPFAAALASVLAAAAWTALAVLVLTRRSRDLLGLFLSAGFLSFGLVMGTFTNAGGIIAAGQSHPWAPPWPATVLLIANALSLPWAYCFPDGRFVPRWSLALAGIWAAVWLVPPVDQLLRQSALGQRALTALVASLVASTGLSFIYRFTRRSTAVERQQLKWGLLGAIVFVVVYLLIVPTGALVLQGNPSSQAVLFRSIHSALLSLAVIAIPVALGIAIFRQGLLDIDFIINRTLTYGGVTIILAVAFAAISGISNQVLAALTGRRSEAVLLASVVPVALAFVPVRARALKIADRFVADRKVTTLLFLDIVGSTDLAYALGDRSWRELLERFRSTVRRGLKRGGGKEIDTAGDGFFVTFDAPERAIRCAHALIAAVRPLDIELRVGVHIGEVQVDGSHVEGANVHLAARVMAAAGAGDVLVSAALRDVLAGSVIAFQDRGARQLKGVPGEVELYAAVA